MPADNARKRLDKYIELRGQIALRGAAAASVKKADVEGFLTHVTKLVAKTGGTVHTEAKRATGKALW